MIHSRLRYEKIRMIIEGTSSLSERNCHTHTQSIRFQEVNIKKNIYMNEKGFGKGFRLITMNAKFILL